MAMHTGDTAAEDMRDEAFAGEMSFIIASGRYSPFSRHAVKQEMPSRYLFSRRVIDAADEELGRRCRR